MPDGILKSIERLTPAKRAALAALVLAVVVSAAYSGSLGASFHFDDHHQIVDNPHIRDLTGLPRFFVDSGSSSYRADRTHYRPMTLATFAVNHALGGYDVRGYRLFNMGLHLINALLVFVLVGMVIRRAGGSVGGRVFGAQLFAAAMFALHPVQTHAVTYISGRSALLAASFTMLSLACFIRCREGGGRGMYWAAASALSFLFGLWSKETALNLLFYMAAYDAVFTMPGGGRTTWRRAAMTYLPMLAAAAVYFVFRRYAESGVTMPVWEVGMPAYWLSQARAALLYARLIFLPVNQVSDYAMPVAASPDAASLAGIALAGAFGYALYRLRRREPVLTLFGLWFFAGFVVESVLVPITDIAVEYRLYMPLAAFFGFAAVAGWRLTGHRPARLAAATCVLVLFGLLSYNRNLVWADPYTLWGDVVTKAPHSARAHVNYGTALLDLGRYDEAVAEFERALSMDPDVQRSYKAHNNLGSCYFETGRLDMAEAEFIKAVELKPDCVECLLNLGKLYHGAGAYDNAADALAGAVSADPYHVEARYVLAMTLRALGRRDEALLEMAGASRLAPESFEVAYNLAVMYAEYGMAAEALGQTRVSLGLAADDGQRGLALSLKGRLERRTAGPR